LQLKQGNSMEIEIIQENQNPLFNRKEIKFHVEADVTPSEKEIIELIAQKFSSQPENISVKGIHGKFGTKEFTVGANIYASQEDKETIENKKKKSAEKLAAPPEGVPSDEGKGEAPATEAPAQEQAENKEQAKTEEAEKQELTKPDEEPVSENKPEEKQDA